MRLTITFQVVSETGSSFWTVSLRAISRSPYSAVKTPNQRSARSRRALRKAAATAASPSARKRVPSMAPIRSAAEGVTGEL
jgi:hypothetical protein